MIYAREHDKYRYTADILARHLAELSDAEYLRELAMVFSGGGPVSYVTSTRLLSIAATCAENKETSE